MKTAFLAAFCALLAIKAGAQNAAPVLDERGSMTFLTPSTPTARGSAQQGWQRSHAESMLLGPSASLSGLNAGIVSPHGLDALFDGTGKAKDWELRFSFGPVRTRYFGTDIKVQSSKVDGVFKNAQLSERNGMNNYQFWDKSKTGNALNWIDEPTNRFVFTAENKRRGYAVSLAVSHPKFLVVDGDKVNQAVRFQGTIEGKPVDRDIRINDLFGQWMLTSKLLDISAQFEKVIPLWRGEGWGSLSFAPGVGLGAVVSTSYQSYRVPGTLWDSVGYDHPARLIGGSATFSNRLTYTVPNGKFDASLAYDLTGSRIKYPFLDGWAEQYMNYQSVWLSLGARLGRPARGAERPSRPWSD